MKARPWGRFIDVVNELKVVATGGPTSDNTMIPAVDRTARGVKFMAPGALSPIIVDFSCAVDDDKSAGNLSLTEVDQPAFLTFNLAQCSTLSGDLTQVSNYTDEIFNALKSEALAYAATVRLSAQHYALSTNSDVVTASTTLVDVIGAVEAGLAERISNEQGYVFISPRYLTNAVSADILTLVNGQWYTPSGHVVISDAGHRPYNVVYGTGAMGWALMGGPDDPNFGSYLDRTRNIATWRKETYGLVVYNPAWSVRATLTGGVSG
jgi:hypothetical protein